MIEKTYFQCEVCGRLSQSEHDIIECEREHIKEKFPNLILLDYDKNPIFVDQYTDAHYVYFPNRETMDSFFEYLYSVGEYYDADYYSGTQTGWYFWNADLRTFFCLEEQIADLKSLLNDLKEEC